MTGVVNRGGSMAVWWAVKLRQKDNRVRKYQTSEFGKGLIWYHKLL